VRELEGRLGTTVVVADLTGDGVAEVTAGAWRLPADGRFHAGELRTWTLDGAWRGATIGAPAALTIVGDGSHQQLGRRLLAADVTDDGRIELVSATRRRAR